MDARQHTDFTAAFTPQTVFNSKNGRISVRQVAAGEITLPSGKIAACDPSNLWSESSAVPFATSAAPGSYPVLLSVTEDGGIACAMIRFSHRPAATWEMAVRPGQDSSSLPLGKFFGYGVDAGLGCFIDLQTLEALTNEVDDTYFQKEICDALYEGETYRSWASFPVDSETGGNLVVFSSGYGDGCYASYWGIDDRGELTSLVTDFGLLVEYLTGRSTFLLRDWIGKELVHRDLTRKALSVRLLPPDDSASHGLRLELRGGYCDSIITNAGNEYSSDHISYCESGGVGTYDFRFAEPLEPEAAITLKYGLGVQPMPRVP